LPDEKKKVATENLIKLSTDLFLLSLWLNFEDGNESMKKRVERRTVVEFQRCLNLGMEERG
jgi:hypothetical protein